jgi:methyl-accepting chemotaxis protein WspA
VIGGKFAGIAGINRRFDVLLRIAEGIKQRSLTDVFILSPGGQLVASTASAGDASDGARGITDAYGAIASRWLSAPRGSATVFEARDPVLREDCLYATARAPVGDWTVVTRRPKSEVLADANRSMLRNAALGVSGMVLVGGLLTLVGRGITTRVRRAAGAADRIASGDLTEAVPASSSGDETGALMRSMNEMDARLNSLVGDVKQAGIRLNSTATEIAATSKQQEASTATFGAASNQIAAAVKEISATSRDLVQTVDAVNRNAQATAELAGTGRAGLQGMESVMNDLERGTRSIADKLGAISERSQKITAIITTIAKVADQTNILSINAAIEAEKAGEVGAGFLVIAREIRRLADQTASATLDIEQMVRQMQSAVSSGVMEMDRFADQVRRGVRDVSTAGSQLTEIINRVNSSTESFRSVSESVQAQSEGAQQISEAMGSLVANATQTTQSAQEFGRAAADLRAAIGVLRDAVSRFKLRG